MKSFLPKDPGQNRAWFLVDAENQILGRLASRVAELLRGKQKPSYSPQVDMGDFVVVINAQKVRLSGKKELQKTYSFFSGYRSGLKDVTAARLRERHPDRMISLAVRGMLPDNKLARKEMTRLKVYAGSEHPHSAQNPQTVDLKRK